MQQAGLALWYGARIAGLLMGVAAMIAAVGFLVRQLRHHETNAFEIKTTDGGRWDRTLIDKRTGRMWMMSCDGKSTGQDCDGNLYWFEVYVDGITPRDAPSAKRFHHMHPDMR